MNAFYKPVNCWVHVRWWIFKTSRFPGRSAMRIFKWSHGGSCPSYHLLLLKDESLDVGNTVGMRQKGPVRH